MTTPTPEQIEAAFYALRSETIEETWFEREIRQALTAKDARIKELEEAVKRALPLVKLVTIGQVLEAGDTEIEAAGINPWCVNEGRAEKSDKLNAFFLETTLAAKE